jgi:hypothetical protein
MWHLFHFRQDFDRLEVDPRGEQLWRSPETFVWSLSLRFRCRTFIRWPLRSIWIMGQDSASVGSLCWKIHSPIRRPYQGALQAFFLRIFFIFKWRGIWLHHWVSKHPHFLFSQRVLWWTTTDRDIWTKRIWTSVTEYFCELLLGSTSRL